MTVPHTIKQVQWREASRRYRRRRGIPLSHNEHHGKRASPEYRVWANMHSRCSTPALKCFKNYGGRGIQVCIRWASFGKFFADMGPRPTPRHTIERRENSGNYEPGNCEWAIRKKNNRNKRNNRVLTFQSRTQCLQAWADEIGVPRETIAYRLNTGRSIAEAFHV